MKDIEFYTVEEFQNDWDAMIDRVESGETLGIVNEDEGVCNRATFIIDPEGIIQHVSVNHLDTGRNAKEILRTLKAIKAGGLTGCEWEPGDDFVA